jgi:hypothetical protein
MARSFLRGVRVISKNELKSSILKYIEGLNQSPVIFIPKFLENSGIHDIKIWRQQ